MLSLYNNSIGSQTRDVQKIIDVVKNVLVKNENRMREFLELSLEDFAGKMWEASLIDQSTAIKLSYSTIIDQFVLSMNFMDNQQEVEEHCVALLKAIWSMGGPYVKLCKAIKEQFIKEVKDELNVTLHVDYFF